MPSKKTPAIKAKKELPEIPKELVEQFVTGPMGRQLGGRGATSIKFLGGRPGWLPVLSGAARRLACIDVLDWRAWRCCRSTAQVQTARKRRAKNKRWRAIEAG
ncbi:hypothetical protein [Pseudomonas sp. 8Z]|uniref:hypothetical protein n=1 Tax=Pseudomonas sp. 8Z TaxID=2653166 RepID=UPI0013598EF2|nr:hypothetical protein [Pseudomonas sp. 8Z]